MTAPTRAGAVPDGLEESVRGGLVELLAQVADAERLRVADREGSLAEQSFVRSWSLLVAGTPLDDVAAADVAAPLAALGSQGWWRAGLAARTPWGGLAPAPAFVALLAAQPQAGATAPGRRRIVVEPPETHGDHCSTVALYAALLAPAFGADPARAFLLGLAHLHNAALRERVEETHQERALAQLPGELVADLRPLLALRTGTEDPLSRTFHTADALDRALQVHHHARAAAFTAPRALEDLDLVHVGPEQQLQLAVLDAAGLS